jgi:hypothetical protein
MMDQKVLTQDSAKKLIRAIGLVEASLSGFRVL